MTVENRTVWLTYSSRNKDVPYLVTKTKNITNPPPGARVNQVMVDSLINGGIDVITVAKKKPA